MMTSCVHEVKKATEMWHEEANEQNIMIIITKKFVQIKLSIEAVLSNMVKKRKVCLSNNLQI